MMPIAALIAMLAIMLIELQVSRRNEQTLCARGAVAAFDPVYPLMRVAYPGLFVAMAAEGLLASQPGLHAIAMPGEPFRLAIAGALVLIALVLVISIAARFATRSRFGTGGD